MSFVVKEMPRVDYQLGALGAQPGAYQVPGTIPQALQTQHLPVGAQPPDDPQRWSQYQHLWRQHVYNNINGRIFYF